MDKADPLEQIEIQFSHAKLLENQEKYEEAMEVYQNITKTRAGAQFHPCILRKILEFQSKARQGIDRCREQMNCESQMNYQLIFRDPPNKKEDWDEGKVKHLHYMAHIENIPSILSRGILCYNKAKKINHIDFASSNTHLRVQKKRSPQVIGPRGETLHDYVPLHFSTHTPMQWLLTKGSHAEKASVLQEDLVFIECNFHSIKTLPGRIFTDGNAASDETKFFVDISDLTKLNWNTINREQTRYPKNQKYKREKMAEFLVPGQIAPQHFTALHVFNKNAGDKLNKLIAQFHKSKHKKIDPSFLKTLRCYSGDKIHFLSDQIRGS